MEKETKKFSNFDAALAMQSEGKYVSALYYCQRLEQDEGDCLPYISVLRGDIYFDMGLTGEAVREFMRAYAEDKQEEGAIEGLIDCYKILDKGAAVFYMAEAVKEGIPAEAFIDDMTVNERFFEMTDRTDYSEHLDAAIVMIESNRKDEALATLDKIPTSAVQYADACIVKGTVAFEEGDLEKAESMVNAAMAAKKDCAGSYILKAMIADKRGDAVKLNEITDSMEKIECADQSDALKVALALYNYGFTDKAAAFLKQRMVNFPYDKICMLFLASLKADEKDWRKYCYDAQLIYRDDEMVNEITTKLLDGEDVKIPDAIFEIRLKWLGDIKDALIGVAEIRDKQLKRKIKWLLHSGEDELFQATAATAIAKDDYFTDIIDDALIDPMVTTTAKRHMLYAKFCDEKVDVIKFVAYNAYREVEVVHPTAPDTLKAAFYQNCMLFSLSGEYESSRLVKALNYLTERYSALSVEQANSLSIIAVAALMNEVAGGTRKVFNCSEDEYNKAKEMLAIE